MPAPHRPPPHELVDVAPRTTTRRTAVAALVGTTVLFGGGCTSGSGGNTDGARPPATPARKLVWEDDFDGPAGAAPDPSNWTPEHGGGGWGNGELQTYTDDIANLAVDGAGNLVITARALTTGAGTSWTSARITTFGKRTVTNGRVEVRAKVPRGQGIWPAAWTLGQNIQDVGWPACGEIDVVESIDDATEVLQTVHGRRADGERWYRTLTEPVSAPLSEDFHVYAADWTPDAVVFSVDGRTTGQVRRSDLGGDEKWPFDAAQYVLLNVAVGGRLPGYPDDTTPTTASMLVDRVSLYE
ncbi:family 16 glycosylhydrolase [Kineococcus aurantiacus]|uniref:Beta-glucanase (GH16 family) n=1 Tax=Kineococcus aurantiacus TaxID=37633 RepID=A0A7Y9J296_9ACTN|nr:beta-glucanase (GH16 family) [Kineococcus aurantiacus]